MCQNQRYGERRWIIEGKMETGHHARGDIHRKAQPRPSQWQSRLFVYDDDVHRSMIDFDETERIAGPLLGQGSGEDLACSFSAMARCGHLAGIEVVQTPADRPVIGS